MKGALLLDNDEIANYVHTHILVKSHTIHHVDVKRSPSEALAYLMECMEQRTEWPELIFLEVRLLGPDTDSFMEVYERFCLQAPFPPQLIFLSSSIDERNFALCKKYGIKHYIQKPLSAAKLRELAEAFPFSSAA